MLLLLQLEKPNRTEVFRLMMVLKLEAFVVGVKKESCFQIVEFLNFRNVRNSDSKKSNPFSALNFRKKSCNCNHTILVNESNHLLTQLTPSL